MPTKAQAIFLIVATALVVPLIFHASNQCYATGGQWIAASNGWFCLR
jgi:hypothetical protein